MSRVWLRLSCLQLFVFISNFVEVLFRFCSTEREVVFFEESLHLASPRNVFTCIFFNVFTSTMDVEST